MSSDLFILIAAPVVLGLLVGSYLSRARWQSRRGTILAVITSILMALWITLTVRQAFDYWDNAGGLALEITRIFGSLTPFVVQRYVLLPVTIVEVWLLALLVWAAVRLVMRMTRHRRSAT